MTTEEPKVQLTGRYELKDTATLLDVNRTTVLRWTRDGKLKSGIKKSNHRKFWLGADIIKFWRGAM